MTKQQQKSVIRLITVTAVVVLVMLVIALIVNLVKLSAANARLRELEELRATLDEAIVSNSAVIDYRSSSAWVEDYARLYLDMIYNGEIPIEVQ